MAKTELMISRWGPGGIITGIAMLLIILVCASIQTLVMAINANSELLKTLHTTTQQCQVLIRDSSGSTSPSPELSERFREFHTRVRHLATRIDNLSGQRSSGSFEHLLARLTSISYLQERTAKPDLSGMLRETLPAARPYFEREMREALKRLHDLKLTLLQAGLGAAALTAILVPGCGLTSIGRRRPLTHYELAKAALQNVPIPALALDSDLKVLYANSMFSRTQGMKPVDVLAKDFYSLIPSTVAESIKSRLLEAPGSDKLFEGNIAFVPDDNGTMFRMSLNRIKMADHQLFCAEFINTSAEIEAAIIKRDVLAIAGHEMRTPLTSIPALIGLAQSDDSNHLTDLEQSELSAADSSLQILCTLTNNLMEMAASELSLITLTLSAITLSNLISRSIDDNEQAISMHQLSIHSDIPDAVLFVDKQKVMKALSTILSYIFEVANQGSDISIAASVLEGVSHIKIMAHTSRSLNPQEEKVKLLFPSLVMHSHGGSIELTHNQESGDLLFLLSLPSKLLPKKIEGAHA